MSADKPEPVRGRVDRIAVIRQVYGDWERGNYRAGLELYDPEMTLEVHNPIPDAGVYEGVAGLQRYMRYFLETWDEYKLQGVGFEEGGDSVVVQVHHGGRATGAWTEMDYFQIWTFAGDRVVRVDISQTPDVGLDAARRAHRPD